MSIIRRMRKQKAIYWRRLTPDKYGTFSYASPVEVSCRWDDCTEEFRNAQGQLEASSAVVYPDRQMYIGDILKKSEIESDTPDDPREDTEIFEIKRFDVTPNLRNTENLYTAYLT